MILFANLLFFCFYLSGECVSEDGDESGGQAQPGTELGSLYVGIRKLIDEYLCYLVVAQVDYISKLKFYSGSFTHIFNTKANNNASNNLMEGLIHPREDALKFSEIILGAPRSTLPGNCWKS